jgi:hypothetical protein
MLLKDAGKRRKTRQGAIPTATIKRSPIRCTHEYGGRDSNGSQVARPVHRLVLVPQTRVYCSLRRGVSCD